MFLFFNKNTTGPSKQSEPRLFFTSREKPEKDQKGGGHDLKNPQTGGRSRRADGQTQQSLTPVPPPWWDINTGMRRTIPQRKSGRKKRSPEEKFRLPASGEAVADFTPLIVPVEVVLIIPPILGLFSPLVENPSGTGRSSARTLARFLPTFHAPCSPSRTPSHWPDGPYAPYGPVWVIWRGCEAAFRRGFGGRGIFAGKVGAFADLKTAGIPPLPPPPGGHTRRRRRRERERRKERREKE